MLLNDLLKLLINRHLDNLRFEFSYYKTLSVDVKKNHKERQFLQHKADGFIAGKIMNRNKSEILDAFVKLAKEKDLIDPKAPEKAQKILLQEPHRADSLSMKDLLKLYNLKPDLPKGMEYTRNIIEVAHPHPMIIGPAYDRLNALVENENERQDISLNILLQSPLRDGNNSQRRYAESQLSLSLLKLSNSLGKNKTGKLAAVCQQQLQSQGVLPAIVPAIAFLIAAGIGILWAQQHLDAADDGFTQNSQKLVSEVEDLINSNSNYEVGSDYTPEFRRTMLDFRTRLLDFAENYKNVSEIIRNYEKPKSAKELMDQAKDPKTQEASKAFEMMKKMFDQMSPYLDTIKKEFDSEGYKQRQTANKGAITSLIDKMQVFHGGKGLINDDFDDVSKAIPAYQKSVKDILNILQQASVVQKSVQDKVERAVEKKAPPPSSSLPGKKKPSLDIDEEHARQLEEFMKDDE
jgi:hypothetical protein